MASEERELSELREAFQRSERAFELALEVPIDERPMGAMKELTQEAFAAADAYAEFLRPELATVEARLTASRIALGK